MYGDVWDFPYACSAGGGWVQACGGTGPSGQKLNFVQVFYRGHACWLPLFFFADRADEAIEAGLTVAAAGACAAAVRRSAAGF